MTGLILPQATSATSVATAEMPLPDAETVFRTLAAATGPHLKRLPDGETGIRKTWIRFLQQVLADRGGERRTAVQIHPVGWQVIARNTTPAVPRNRCLRGRDNR
jgi:hypothetical protein